MPELIEAEPCKVVAIEALSRHIFRAETKEPTSTDARLAGSMRA